MTPIIFAGICVSVIMWSVYQIQVPVHGIVFDFDVIEQSKNSFVGIHKILFNSTHNIPMSCIHVIASGANKEDVLQRTSLPGPIDQEIVLGKLYGMCSPFQPDWNGSLTWLRFVCALIAFSLVSLEFISWEFERERKTHVLPMRKNDSLNRVHAVVQNNEIGVEKEV